MKPTISFEPYEGFLKSILVPPTPVDFRNLEDVANELIQSFEKYLNPSISIWGVELTVENLLALEKVCKIEITQATIDK